ncbi:MAG: SDR family NAD(P)-dependent oxidoreductase, partial [bacterium]|nr:SDR family NAD(P)-dependent oxidoreductase [bacterium]
MDLNGKTAIVTGGASGLGYAVAQLFLEKGMRVGVLDLPGEENQEKVEDLGPEASFLPGDITQSETIQQGLQRLQEQWEPIRVAVNCAGIGIAVKTLSKGKACPLEIFQKTVEINLTGTFNVCRLAAETMATLEPLEEGERGVIVNTSSIAA